MAVLSITSAAVAPVRGAVCSHGSVIQRFSTAPPSDSPISIVRNAPDSTRSVFPSQICAGPRRLSRRILRSFPLAAPCALVARGIHWWERPFQLRLSLSTAQDRPALAVRDGIDTARCRAAAAGDVVVLRSRRHDRSADARPAARSRRAALRRWTVHARQETASKTTTSKT